MEFVFSISIALYDGDGKLVIKEDEARIKAESISSALSKAENGVAPVQSGDAFIIGINLVTHIDVL